MENIKFDWHAGIIEAKTPAEEVGSLVISGELVNGEICANNFALDTEELPSIAKQVKNINLRIDHGKSVRDVIGGFRIGTYDGAKKRIMFEAEVDDPHIQRLVAKGRLKYISIGASADAFCSKCGEPTKPLRVCECKGAHDIIKNVLLKEASIVTEPAYKSSVFKPVGFMASISSALAYIKVTPESSKEDKVGPYSNKIMEEKRKMSEEKTVTANTDEMKGLKAEVSKLTTIVASLANKMQKAEDEKAEKAEAERLAKIEAEKKEKEEAEKTEKTEMATKLDAIVSKLEELINSKSEKKEKKEKMPPEEDEEEDESKKKDDVEASNENKTDLTGGKIEDANEDDKTVTGDALPGWFLEAKEFAQKEGVLF